MRQDARWLVVLTLGLSASCARPDLDEVRAACDVAPGAVVQPVFTERVPYNNWTLTEGCVEALGDSYNLKWRSFGTEPRPVSIPADTFDRVMGALFMLAAADIGTVGEFREKGYVPAFVKGAVLESAAELGLGEGDILNPAVDIWFRERIKSIHLGEVDSLAEYWSFGDKLVFDDRTYEPEVPGTYNGIVDEFGAGEIFGSLMHEAAHADIRDHVVCTKLGWRSMEDYDERVEEGELDYCDDDGEAAYGAGIAFMRLRQENLVIRDESEQPSMSAECQTLLGSIYEACDRFINDTAGMKVCDFSSGSVVRATCSELNAPWFEPPQYDLDEHVDEWWPEP